MNGFFLSLLNLILIAAGLNAQVSYYNYTVNNGLPSNEVYYVLQDKQGYIWASTDHGVARYDGHEFKTFTTENGLTDNVVFVIKEDQEGKIWCLTFSGGICYFDGKGFKPHPNNDTIKALCKRDIPTSWAVTDNSTVWLGFYGGRFCKVCEHETKVFTVPKPIACDSADFVIFNFRNGQFAYTAVPAKSIYNIQDSEITSIQKYRLPISLIGGLSKNFAITKMPDGDIVVSQWKGLMYISPQGKMDQMRYTTNEEITGTKCLDAKSIWVLMQNGISYCLENDKGNLREIDSLKFNNAATGIITDNQGNTWVSTLNAGLFLIQNPDVKIFNFHGQSIDSRAYSFRQFGEYLYVGLTQNCYFQIDKNFGSKFFQGKKFPSAVLDFAPYGKNGVITDVDISVDLKDMIIFKDMILLEGKKLLGGGTGGVVILDSNFRCLFSSARDIGFTQRVTRMAKISPARFILGTNTGLFYFDTNNGYRISEEKIFANTRINACKRLNDSVYAVATRGKGIYLSIKNNFFNITTYNGLKTNLNEDLYFQNDSILWVASYKGLAKVHFLLSGDSIQLHIKCYTKEDGLCSDQVNAIFGYNSYIWLATNEGLCYFKPPALGESAQQIPIYFGNTYINGVKRNTDSLELNYYENNPLIEFHGLYFKAVSGITYKVRLKGREPWKYTSQNFVQYFNLPPGKYELEVAAEDKFGKYISDPISLKFTIHPKFTDTFFFRLTMAFLALLIIATIVYLLFRNQRLRSQNYIGLLKSEFKALNYQINPHFIFNVLNSIQYYILRKDSEKAVHFLNSFSTLIRRIVTNSRQQYISIIEEVECLKEYMDLEKLRLDNKFDYEINIDSHLDIEGKILLPMIIQPIVENAIWHGIVPSGTIGKVKVDFRKEGNALSVRVEDNGVGLGHMDQQANRSPQHLSMAMSNVRERLKIIGDLNDSSWYIQMEDKKRDLGLNESGAIVTIRFPEIKMD